MPNTKECTVIERLTIIPDGYEIDKQNSTFEKIVFKKIIKKPRPVSFEKIGLISGFYVNNDSLVRPVDNLTAKDQNTNIFPTASEAMASIAMAQLCQLRDAWNDGWKADWMNTDETKFSVSIVKGEPVMMVGYEFHRPLSFKSEKMTEDFIKTFRELIMKASPFL